MKKCFEYRHTVSFEQTNLVGNVYFVNHFKWQGRCRELFLFKYAPEILSQIESGILALVTLNCSCEYFDELKAFDEVLIEMRLEDISRSKIKMEFDYYNVKGSEKILSAKGYQEISCMKKEKNKLSPVDVPAELKDALIPFLSE